MLNVALVGLLAGSLLTAAPGDDDDKKGKKADAPQSVVVVGDDAQEPILVDSWALGRSDNNSPIKLWIEGGFGEAEGVFGPDGEDRECSIGPGGVLISECDIVTQRAAVGVQIDPISFDRFAVGIGAILTAAKNEIQPGSNAVGLLASTGLESDFGLQNAKIYVEAKGRTLGVHAGYLFDLGDQQEFAQGGIPTNVARSDNRNAFQLGADFDYPANNWRIFGAIDYFQILEDCPDDTAEQAYPEACLSDSRQENVFGEEGDGVWNFLLGAGVKLGPAEIGLATQIVARDRQPVDRNGEGTPGTTPNIGGHVASLSPYVNLSPGSLPVSVYIKGGVQDEYNVYGLPIGGANGPKPSFGLTGGIAIGFGD